MNRIKQWLFRTFGGLRLQTKMLTAFLAAALIPIMLVSAYSSRYMRNSLYERVEEGISSSLHQYALGVEDKLQQYTHMLQYLMYDHQIGGFFNNESVSYYDIYYQLQEVYLPLLMTIRQLNEDIDHIGIFTGNTALRSRDDTVRLLREIPWPDQADAVLSKRAIKWFVSDGDLIGMGPLMRTSHHQPDNLVYLQTSAKKLPTFDPMITDTWSLALTDGNELLLQTDHGGWTPKEAQWISLNAGKVQLGNEKMLVIRQRLSNTTGWELLFICPYSSLKTDLQKLLWLNVLVVAGSLSALALISVWISFTVTRRVNSLNQSMARVEQGVLNEKPEVAEWEKDEISELTIHFGNMLAALNNYIEINYKNQIVLRDAEKKMLQAQINPHFLYNTLSMINWMALEHDEIEISEVLIRLSQYYRMILLHSDNRVTVKDEVENITCYLELQALLHEDSFDTSLQIDPAIMDCPMIGMVLQPIAENAIQHGIDTLRAGRGLLAISGYRDGDHLRFVVRDNGEGMAPEDFLAHLQKSSKGYGLKNVNDRLRMEYGQAYGLRMLEHKGRGTAIEVVVPYMEPSPIQDEEQQEETT